MPHCEIVLAQVRHKTRPMTLLLFNDFLPSDILPFERQIKTISRVPQSTDNFARIKIYCIDIAL